MIKSSVTISLVPSLAGGPWVYWDDLETSIPKARAVGFDAVELFTASAEAVNPDTLSKLLAENNMQLSAVGTGAGKALYQLHLSHPDQGVRRNASDYIAAMIDFGGRFGAPAIIGSMQGRQEQGVERGQAIDWLAESLNELGQKAAAYGVKLLYEPLNRYETDLINRLGDGVDLIRSLEIDNVALLADLFHMNIEEESIPAIISAAGNYIGYIHFADSNRRAAGMGHTDLKGVAQALSEINYAGYVSAEVLSYPDSDTAAARTMAAFKQFMVPAFK